MKKILLTTTALVLSSFIMLGAATAQTSTYGEEKFNSKTNLGASTSDIQTVWGQLKNMGTTDFLGGYIGSFRLDEASMVAGAMTVGSSEFDNFLRTGKLSSGVANAGELMSKNMQGASGIDLSSVVGSYTKSETNNGNIGRGNTAVAGGEACDPSVAEALNAMGNEYVNESREIAMSEYGYSPLKAAGGQGGQNSSGFSGLGCLDKLFMNAGTDIFMKPPTLGDLTSQIQSWSCEQAMSVAEQVNLNKGDGFNTAQLGGFFPDLTMGHAQQGNMIAKPNVQAGELFGQQFASFKEISKDEIMKKMGLN